MDKQTSAIGLNSLFADTTIETEIEDEFQDADIVEDIENTLIQQDIDTYDDDNELTPTTVDSIIDNRVVNTTIDALANNAELEISLDKLLVNTTIPLIYVTFRNLNYNRRNS